MDVWLVTTQTPCWVQALRSPGEQDSHPHRLVQVQSVLSDNPVATTKPVIC